MFFFQFYFKKSQGYPEREKVGTIGTRAKLLNNSKYCPQTDTVFLNWSFFQFDPVLYEGIS